MTVATIEPNTPRKPRILLWTAVWIALYFIGIALLSAIDAPDGTPWIDSSVLGESVRTIGLVGAAFGPSLVNIVKDTRTVKHEVKNDHSANLRVESDTRHAETQREFARLHDSLETVNRNLNGVRDEVRGDREEVRQDVRDLRRDLDLHSKRIRLVENRRRP